MLTEHRSTPPLAATYARSYEAQKTAKLDYQTKELQRVDTPRQTTENNQFCRLTRQTNLNSHLIQEIHYLQKISDDFNFGHK